MVNKLILIIILLSPIASYGHPSEDFAKQDSLDYYLDLGEFENAVHFLDNEILKNPSADLYISRGLAKIETYDLEGALLDLRQSLDLNPKNDTSYYNIGYVYYLQDQYERSINYYDSALMYNEDNIYYLIA